MRQVDGPQLHRRPADVTSGGIWLDEQRIDDVRPEARRLGMVFQTYALFPHMAVCRNISFGLRMRKVTPAEIRRRTDEAIRVVRFDWQQEKVPSQLSGGQQQHVAIARAIEPGAAGLQTVVETVEYRGREFVGTGRAVDGSDLVFRSPQPIEIGAQVILHADADRVLIFPAPAARA